MADEDKVHRPWTFVVPKWYGYILGLMFALYGGVKIVLGALDHTYEGVGQLGIFLLLGIFIMGLAFGFRDTRRWGWYGLVTVNGLVVLISLWGLRNPYNVLFLILSVASLGLLFMPGTKTEVFSHGQN